MQVKLIMLRTSLSCMRKFTAHVPQSKHCVGRQTTHNAKRILYRHSCSHRLIRRYIGSDKVQTLN
jgi:hypothetical protein